MSKPISGINNMPELPTELFRVFDNGTGEFWSTEKGKSVWARSGHAKNAWNAKVRNEVFSEQHRYEIIRFYNEGWKI